MLKGFRCRSHRKNVSFKECLETNSRTCCMPLPLKVSIIVQSFQHPVGLSVSGLLWCMRKYFWEQTEDFYSTLSGSYYALRGSMVHYVLENPGLDHLVGRVDRETMLAITDAVSRLTVKKRFSRNITIDGKEIVLTGEPDCFDQETGILHEYKTIADSGEGTILRDGAKAGHQLQTQIYAWILRANGFTVKGIQIHYLTMRRVLSSGTVVRYKSRDENIPRVALMSDKDIEALIIPRIVVYLRARDESVIPARVSQEGRWMCKSEFCSFVGRCIEREERTQE